MSSSNNGAPKHARVHRERYRQQNPYESTLSPNRVNLLPNVYHRPQVGPGLRMEFTRNIRLDFDNRPDREISYDSGANQSREWTRELRDNWHVSMAFMKALNKPNRTKKDGELLEAAKREYLESLAQFNVCFNPKCKKPIKIQRTTAHLPDAPVGDNVILRKAAMFMTPQQAEKFGYDANDAKNIVLADKRKRHKSGECEFVESHFTSETNTTTEIYADLIPHFEVFAKQTSDGILKYYVAFVDGSGRKIGVRTNKHSKPGLRAKIVKREYFEIESFDGGHVRAGKALTDAKGFPYIPPVSYRVIGEKCECITQRHCGAIESLHKSESKHIAKCKTCQNLLKK